MRRIVLSVVAALTVGVVSARAELIDRILAVVEGQIITLSDVRAALTFGLVPADVSEDPVDAAMQRLIDHRLTLAEVERYAPAEPATEAVDAAFAAVRSRFADARAFETALNQSAMSPDELRRFLRDTLRLEIYIQQRFTSSAQPSDEDLLRYYQSHQPEFTLNGVLQPFDTVRTEAQRRLIDERRSTLVREWAEGLRRRGSVVVLYFDAPRQPPRQRTATRT